MCTPTELGHHPVCLEGDRLVNGRICLLFLSMPELPIFDELNHTTTAPAPPPVIKVAIIEDQRDIREGLATMFKFTGGYRSTGCYRSMEEALEKIFERFYTHRPHQAFGQNSGLGLSICKQIIHGHGGRIEVKSKIGVGTVFSLILPRRRFPSARPWVYQPVNVRSLCIANSAFSCFVTMSKWARMTWCRSDTSGS